MHGMPVDAVHQQLMGSSDLRRKGCWGSTPQLPCAFALVTIRGLRHIMRHGTNCIIHACRMMLKLMSAWYPVLRDCSCPRSVCRYTCSRQLQSHVTRAIRFVKPSSSLIAASLGNTALRGQPLHSITDNIRAGNPISNLSGRCTPILVAC